MNTKASCAIVIKVLAEQGVTDAVVSPGSRNTPLILALDNEPRIRCHVVIDERSAAFIALGLSQISRRPTIVCCTSGTAVLNYAPAVAEAYYQCVPMIVLSADRPDEWIDQDDSQTIRQHGALSNFVKQSYDIPEYDEADDDMCWYSERTANDAFLTSMTHQPGPVHINMHFSDPLSRPLIHSHTVHCVEDVKCHTLFPPVLMKELAEYAATRKVLIIAGGHKPGHKLNRAFAILSHIPNIAIWSETTANLHQPGIITGIDRTLLAMNPDEIEQYKPDIVISYGNALISRKGKEFLRRLSGIEHWSIGWRRDRLADPFKCLTKSIECEPEIFMPHFANALCRLHPSGTFAEKWQRLDYKGIDRLQNYSKTAPWSTLKAFNVLMSRIPPKYNLQLSNGTTIRYAQLFGSKRIHACFCNRGVSGIDGSTSTAIGAALNYSHGTLLITGDMSFAYDIGALAVGFMPEDFRIIVINNNGGEIFRFIKTTSALQQREEYFSVTPVLPLAQLSKAYGIDYFSIESEKALKEKLPVFFAPSLRPAIMEIIVPDDVSARTLAEYFKQI